MLSGNRFALKTRGAEMVLPEKEFEFRANEVRQFFLGT